MKKIFLLIIASLTINYANSQITKGFWMFGGTGSVISGSTTTLNTTYKATAISLNPRGGYFIANKLATGLALNYDYQKSGVGTSFSEPSQAIGLSSFLRYYFLVPTNRINILSEINGGFNKPLNSNKAAFQYGFLGGIAIFLNSSVAIEILPGYRASTINGSTPSKLKTFILNIGLQVHLERNIE